MHCYNRFCISIRIDLYTLDMEKSGNAGKACELKNYPDFDKIRTFNHC
jgi:hypothetical protein